jgi:hypothetical protein
MAVNINSAGYDIKIIPPGTILYKGLRAGPNVSCRSLKDSTMFYITENPAIAGAYARNYLCKFTCEKPLKMFILNRKNLTKILNMPIFTKEEAYTLAFATGVGLTRMQQYEYLVSRLGGNAQINRAYPNWAARFKKGVSEGPQLPGARASLHNINKSAFGALCTKFLTPYGYDGYFAFEKDSPYHRNATQKTGKFHSEMMICNASKKLIRLSEESKAGNVPLLRTPFATNQNIEDVIPGLFLSYALNNKIAYDVIPGRITYVTGGMAVRIISSATNIKLRNNIKTVVENTADFDFTVSSPRQYTLEYLLVAIKKTRAFFDPYMQSFATLVNAYYPSTKITLEILPRRVFDTPKVQNAVTGRLLYTVISYNLKSSGKTIDLADVAICYVPKIDDSWINKTITNSSGLPVLQHKYMLKDIGVLLAKSFFSTNSFNKARNPINGKKKEKGKKDMYRLAALCSMKSNEPCTRMNKLVTNILQNRKNNAKVNAQLLYNELKAY